MDFKRVTYFELFRRAETSARVSAPKLRKRFWNLVTVIFGVPKKSKLAIRHSSRSTSCPCKLGKAKLEVSKKSVGFHAGYVRLVPPATFSRYDIVTNDRRS